MKSCDCYRAHLRVRPQRARSCWSAQPAFRRVLKMRVAEEGQETACAFVLDITGTERLFGPPRALAERLRNALKAAGFRASIAVSANFHTARMLAAASRGITVIPAGEEATALAGLPIALLEIPDDHAETLAIWGIRTAGRVGRVA